MCSYLRMKIRSAVIAAARIKTLLKAANIVFPLLCIACPSVATATGAFTLGAYGPNNVVVGNDIYIKEVLAMTASPQDYTFYFVDGLPTGATASWPELFSGCCATAANPNRGYRPDQPIMLKINVPATVTPNTYNLTLRVQAGGVTQTFPYRLTVNPVPAALPTQVISSIPPIPSLSTWQSNMTTYGNKFCNQASITSQGTWDGNIWFYDGIRVYFQMADYTKDSSWNVCAGYVESVYKPWVLKTPGMAGYFVFPHGLYQAYLRNNNDTDAKTAAIDLATQSAYAKSGGAVCTGVNDGYWRETAYLINAYRIAGYLGSPNPDLYARAVNFELGCIDQEFVSKTSTYHQPFMVGLAMEALIYYYQDTQDPRVPPAIKAAADWLWANATMPDPTDSTGITMYYLNTDNPLAGVPDLNLLIAPAYAWLYKMTGNPVYQQEGDALFQDGVKNACVSCDGKHFSQNYRWSFDYVNWRMHPNITPPAAPTSLNIVQ